MSAYIMGGYERPMIKQESVTSHPVVKAGLSTMIAFGLMTGTGGLADANYLVKRQARGYQFTQFDGIPNNSASAVRSSADNLARIRDVLKPTVSELANIFGVSRQTIYNWQAGELPSAENASRLEDLARVADMFAAEGVSSSAQILRRTVSGGNSLLDIVRDGGIAHEAARALVQVARRETEQRKTLASRLAGRKKPDLPVDYGTPMLDERA